MKSESDIKMEQSLITSIIHMAYDSLDVDDFDVLVGKLNLLSEARGLGAAEIKDRT